LHVQPYKEFVKEEHKKLQEHWIQLANEDRSAAYAGCANKHGGCAGIIMEQETKNSTFLTLWQFFRIMLPKY
jgi:hypothetical protein